MHSPEDLLEPLSRAQFPSEYPIFHQWGRKMMSAKVLIAHVYQKSKSPRKVGGAFTARKLLFAQNSLRTRPR